MPDEAEELETETNEEIIEPITLDDIFIQLQAIETRLIALEEANNARSERERIADSREQPADTPILSEPGTSPNETETGPTEDEPIKRPNRTHPYYRKLW